MTAAGIYEVRKKALYFSGKYVIITVYLYLKERGTMPNIYAAINYETLILFGKFGGGMLGLLLIVWLIAILTPKAAALIDRLAGKPRPERVQDNIKTEEYEVHSFFEDGPLQKQEDKKQEARDSE